MTTFKRICIQTHTVSAENGDSMTIERGREYITSPERDGGEVIVFGSFWAPFPVSCFAGEQRFT